MRPQPGAREKHEPPDTSRQLIRLRCQDKITFGKTIHFVGPECDHHFSPSQEEIRVMALGLSEFTDTVGKIESLTKIFEFEFLLEVVVVDHAPAGRQLCHQGRQSGARKPIRHPPTGNTFFLT